MRPETVELKVTVSGAQVPAAIAGLGLDGGKHWSIHFLEDVTTAVTAATPLLDLAVILRVRRKSDSKGDSTVKLRPCRWSQLGDGFTGNWKDGSTELKIEADWAGSRRGLAAAMTVDWSDGRVSEVSAGTREASAVFNQAQRDFLSLCGAGRVNLATLTLLPAFPATRWDPIDAEVGGVGLRIRPERWTLPGGDDFLELSIVSDPDQAEVQRSALDGFVAAHSLTADPSQQNKTQRVLNHLVTRSLNAG
jgi:hypothetical protein